MPLHAVPLQTSRSDEPLMLINEIPPPHLANQLRMLKVALDARDSYTDAHSDRVTYLACELGKLCSLSDAELKTLHMSAAMHDIGKLGVPDSILLKPGRLLPDEWAVMQSHVTLGYDIVSKVDLPGIDEVALAVRHHHEAYNGSGYPDGLQGEAIPVMARIIALADSYDAMATTRPYRQAMSHARIMDIICSEAGGKYDPYLQAKFIPLVETLARRCA